MEVRQSLPLLPEFFNWINKSIGPKAPTICTPLGAVCSLRKNRGSKDPIKRPEYLPGLGS